MKKLTLIAFLFGMVATNGAGKLPNPIDLAYRDRIVAAIYKAEGGAKTKYPYGIKSVKTSNPKKICENTVSNNFIRWQKAGKTNDFITFLGNRYAPIGAPDDPTSLNAHWIANVKKLSH